MRIHGPPFPPPKVRHECAPYGDAMKRPMSEARISGMVATVALVVMFVLVGLVVWWGS